MEEDYFILPSNFLLLQRIVEKFIQKEPNKPSGREDKVTTIIKIKKGI